MSVSLQFYPPVSHDSPEVIGPWSPWPRETKKRPKRGYIAAGTTVAAAAVFVHCIAPVL